MLVGQINLRALSFPLDVCARVPRSPFNWRLCRFQHPYGAELHAGVQDMACDTFIKISQKCKKHFVMPQLQEYKPFVEELLDEIHLHISDLEPRQIDTFYEAVGYMISAQDSPPARLALIERLMEIPNKKWAEVVNVASMDVSVLMDGQTIQVLIDVLKTNVSACKSIGHPFIDQLGTLYMDMLLFYKTLSENVQSAITQEGEGVAQQPLMHLIRAAQSEILKLIATWISKSENPQVVMENFIPPLLEAVLGNYQASMPVARDTQVLETMVTVVNRLREHISSEVIKIFGAVFESTLEMINEDFTVYPQHRRDFYKLLLAIVTHCFPAFCTLTEEQLKMVVDAVVWGFKHPMRDVADTALKTLKQLLEGAQATPEMAAAFHQVGCRPRLFSPVACHGS